MLKNFLAACLVLIVAGNASAHPGHEVSVVPSDSGWHYLLQPSHLCELLLAVAGCLLVLAFWKRWTSAEQERRLRPLRARRDSK